DYLREQRSRRQTAFDRSRRRRRLHDARARATRKLRAHVTDHLEAAWNVVELLGSIFAELSQHVATLRARAMLRCMHADHARQLGWQHARCAATQPSRLRLIDRY